MRTSHHPLITSQPTGRFNIPTSTLLDIPRLASLVFSDFVAVDGVDGVDGAKPDK